MMPTLGADHNQTEHLVQSLKLVLTILVYLFCLQIAPTLTHLRLLSKGLQLQIKKETF